MKGISEVRSMIKEHLKFDLYDRLLLEKVILVPPMRVPGIMPNEACFLYAVRGKSQFYSSQKGHDENIVAKEGVVMKCGNYLNEWLAADEGNECEAIAVHFYPEVLRKIYDKEFPTFIQKAQSYPSAPIEKVKSGKLLANYIASLQFYFENPELVSEELLKLKVKELILLLAKTDNSDAIQQLIASLFTPTEFSFKELVEANIYTNLTNEELAVLANLSLSTFKREFERVYKTSPAKYFKKRKLDRAATLLTQTNQRIGDIAFNCGFAEISHFSKSFQKYFGVSPSDFRLNHLGK